MKNRIIKVMPILVTFIYLLIGFITHFWHPTWLMFTIIPMASLFTIEAKRERYLTLATVVIVLIYVLFGTLNNTWHPTWLIFFLIPIIWTLFGSTSSLEKEAIESDK